MDEYSIYPRKVKEGERGTYQVEVNALINKDSNFHVDIVHSFINGESQINYHCGYAETLAYCEVLKSLGYTAERYAG